MAAAVVAAAIQSPRNNSPAISIGNRQANGVKNAINTRRKSFGLEPRVTTASSPYSGGRCFIVAASKSPNEEANSNADDRGLFFTSQEEDLNFLLKLGAGSLAGAAAIKYGSILVPQITQPNLTEALIMISTPVIVSILLLIKASSAQQ